MREALKISKHILFRTVFNDVSVTRWMQQIKKKYLTKIVESIILILSITGTLMVTSLNPNHEMIGYMFWCVGNVIAIFFFLYNKMYILSTQFSLYLIMSIRAMIIRI